MPTVFSEGGFRFFFYSKDIGERPHVHARNGDGEVKIWLDSFEAKRIRGAMKGEDVAGAVTIARRRRDEIVGKWEEMVRRGGLT
jgi:hypothetical protein